MQEHIAREYSFNVKDGGTMNPTYLTSQVLSEIQKVNEQINIRLYHKILADKHVAKDAIACGREEAEKEKKKRMNTFCTKYPKYQ